MADSATLEEQCHQKKIFVGGLAHKTTTQNIREYFGHYGSIVDAVVLRWPDGRSRGFGYVTYSDVSSATAALQDAHRIAGQEVDVKRAVPGTNKLFVGGLPQNTSAAELRGYFENFGVVSDAVVMMDPATNRSRGFGFICFLPGQDGATAVTTALEQYRSHRIRGKWIEVKSAAPPHKLTPEVTGDATPSTIAPSPSPTASPVAWPVDVAAPPGLPTHAQPRTEDTAAEQASELPQPAKLSVPPGLAAPLSFDHFAPSYHAPWAAAAVPPAAALFQARPPMGMQPLPSLLATSRTSDAKMGVNASKFDPMKVQLGSSFQLGTQAAKDSDGAVFDASVDLQRSLHELLKFHAEQSVPKAAAAVPQYVPEAWPGALDGGSAFGLKREM